ncbi:MAG: signal peptidase I, partial [Thermoproteus sp.]|nr:signal peptidase I [Thermoproteus sp.]
MASSGGGKWEYDLLALAVAVFAIFFAARYILHVSWPFAVVSSWSMLPTLRVGDFVLLAGVRSCSSLQLGDIIVYVAEPPVPPGEWIIHRVISVSPACQVVTKGDNNPISDQQFGEPPVALGDIVGEAFFVIPYVGVFPLIVRPQSFGGAGIDLWASRLLLFSILAV